MSKIQNSFVLPRTQNTGIVPPDMVRQSATSAGAAAGVKGMDVFEGAKNLFGSLEKKVERFFESHGKDLGFSAKDSDGDEAGEIDHDGFVVHAQDGKTTGAATSSAASTKVNFYGGKVLNQFQVENVYYGNYFKTSTGKADASYNDAFMKQYVSNKDATSIWHQYGVDHGTFAGSTVADKTVKSGQTISQRSIESLVKKMAAADSQSGNNKIYNVLLPPGAVLSQGGATSKQGLGGYHGSVTVNGKQVYYSAICDSKGANGIDFTNGNARGNVTITESHEISEAVTDPDVEVASKTNDWSKLGWMDPQNGEIGDMEVNDAAPGTPLSTMFGTSNGYDVQKIWSQKDGTNEVKAKTSGGVAPLPKPTPA